MWIQKSGAEQHLQDPSMKKYYQNLISSLNDYPNPNFTQIEIDLIRTFANEKNGWFQTQRVQSYIKNVLSSFSKRNPMIGYCQGMNFIVARMSQVLETEEQAFWIFT